VLPNAIQNRYPRPRQLQALDVEGRRDDAVTLRIEQVPRGRVARVHGASDEEPRFPRGQRHHADGLVSLPPGLPYDAEDRRLAARQDLWPALSATERGPGFRHRLRCATARGNAQEALGEELREHDRSVLGPAPPARLVCLTDRHGIAATLAEKLEPGWQLQIQTLWKPGGRTRSRPQQPHARGGDQCPCDES